MQINKIHNIDCKIGLQEYPENFAHSIVTDPPYELGFMGKAWDKTGIAYNTDFWKECYRVLRPGGYLLAFSGTRTYHRMACAIEDAGFEIRDKIDYFYDGNEDLISFIDSLSEEQVNSLKKLIDQQQFTGFMSWIYSQGFPKGLDISKAINKIDSSQDIQEKAKQWEGWKSLMKPANEPICIARKPLSERTVANNVLKWGTGAFNIDDNRIGDAIIKTVGTRNGTGNTYLHDYVSPENYEGGSHVGRFPANVIFDEKAGAILDKQTGVLKSGSNCIRRKEGTFVEHGGLGKAGDVQVTYGDEGGASRFFYCAKASGKERGKYNNHPTVKPTALIKHLVSLVTPVGGISMDPFAGSGTHALACIELGINYIGFEREKTYYDICLKRIKEHQAKRR